MRSLNSIALALLVIGGLNWGLVGIFNFDLVAAIFGGEVGYKSGLSRIIYALVGLAAIYGVTLFAPVTNTDSVRDRRGL